MVYKRGKKIAKRRRGKKFIPKLLGDKFTSRLQYSLDTTINPAAGAAAYYIISGNNLHDPDKTSGATQPRGFDQMMSVFYKYAVISARITVKFVSESNIQCGIGISDRVTGSTSILENQERRWNKSKVQLSNPVSITQYVDVAKYFTLSGGVEGNSLFTCVATSNPIDQVYFHIWAAPQDGAEDTGPVCLNINVEYVALFTVPVKPPLST